MIAEMTASVQKMTVSDAAQRLELTGKDFFLFRNPGSNEINLVFRRKDGNVGWIDPGNGTVKSTQKPAEKVADKTKVIKLKPAAKNKKALPVKKPKAKIFSKKKNKSRR